MKELKVTDNLTIIALNESAEKALEEIEKIKDLPEIRKALLKAESEGCKFSTKHKEDPVRKMFKI